MTEIKKKEDVSNRIVWKQYQTDTKLKHIFGDYFSAKTAFLKCKMKSGLMDYELDGFTSLFHFFSPFLKSASVQMVQESCLAIDQECLDI